MTSRRTSRLLTGLLCVLAIVGVAATAGCTEESGGSGKITLGYGPFPGWLPWRVSEAQGLFEENGIDVELKYFESITDGNNAMASGALDANNQTLNDTLAMLSGGAKPQKIVDINNTSTGADQIIVRDGITSVTDLKGKKIAVEEGIVDHYWLLLVLEDAGIDPEEVELELMTTDAGAAAFVAGQVDAVVVYPPFTTTALEKKGSKAIATTAEYPNACSDHLVVSEDMTKNRPDDVQALVDTWFDTLAWMNDNKQAASEILAEQVGVEPKDYDGYAAGVSLYTLQQNVDAFTPGTTAKNLNFQAEDIADFLVEAGLADDRPKTDGLLDDRFVKAAGQ
ncbi:MAG: ABC transporter substrate-binding protein [Actinophytocola sp.]|uniref:ABC transporter substrate-binding protein n=1 Tax=Actinophytocola sp. TaxID=1872138 RepID=UPI003D6B4CBB